MDNRIRISGLDILKSLRIGKRLRGISQKTYLKAVKRLNLKYEK
jgi:hypothetical protein